MTDSNIPTNTNRNFLVLLSLVVFCMLSNTIFLRLEGQDKSYMQSMDELLIAPSQQEKITIGYATTVTNCSLNSTPEFKLNGFVDGAAVLRHSIRTAHQTSEFDYHMMVFLHPSVDEYCRSKFESLGYEIQIRDTPFNESHVASHHLVKAQGVTCCGFKEYIKLYSYLQFKYPVVVHIDLDVIVLKPMDDLFRLMIYPDSNPPKVHTQWAKNTSDYPSRVDFAFTRDYNMVTPGSRQPHQIGVQGGFLVVRPNRTDFDRLVEIILEEKSFIGSNWGGGKGYGGYYGAGSIQGLAAYYYGEYAKNRSLELNRCYYNQMSDNPVHGTRKIGQEETIFMCRTLEPNLTCQDCRKTPIDDIYTIHLTACGKPQFCIPPRTKGNLCSKFLRAWHKTRYSLEKEWAESYGNYNGVLNATISNTSYHPGVYHGHCKSERVYTPMKFPIIPAFSEAISNGNL